MKTSETFRDTQRVPFMLDKTRKPLFPQLNTKKIDFFWFGKYDIVPEP